MPSRVDDLMAFYVTQGLTTGTLADREYQYLKWAIVSPLRVTRADKQFSYRGYVEDPMLVVP